MKLTIDQALLAAVTVHKQGKIQEAEQLYGLILKTDPDHSDANHNLGLIAVREKRLDDWLSFFNRNNHHRIN